MNGIQYDLQCCGVLDFNDFKMTDAFIKNMSAPASCCRQDPSGSRSDPRALNQKVCDSEITSGKDSSMEEMKALYAKGCFDPTIAWLQRYSYIVIGVCASVAFVEIFVILLAACLCRTIRYYK